MGDDHSAPGYPHGSGKEGYEDGEHGTDHTEVEGDRQFSSDFSEYHLTEV